MRRARRRLKEIIQKEDLVRIGTLCFLSGALLASSACKNMLEESTTGPAGLAPAGAESACDYASARAPWSGEECYDPQLDEADFAGVAENNTFFPLAPGTMWRYESESKDGAEVNTVEVTNNVKMIHLLGGGVIEATEVLDEVYECDDLDDCDLILDNLHERTLDWYAQDLYGFVWYLGEDSSEYEDGIVVSTEGSWESYVDGALPGLIMLADPKIGTTYRQEYWKDEAEDMARVVSLNRPVSVPYGDFEGCLRTQDWNALENASQEDKFYCPGIGLVLEVAKQNVHVELVEVNP
jgi:hypothetical protein